MEDFFYFFFFLPNWIAKFFSIQNLRHLVNNMEEAIYSQLSIAKKKLKWLFTVNCQ